MALRKMKLYDWGRTRDYFPALCAALMYNFMSSKDAKAWTPTSVLEGRYPPENINAGVIITPGHDPDRGAQGDWKSLRSSLKSRANRTETPRPANPNNAPTGRLI